VIRRALNRAGGNQTLAARFLGLHRNTLLTKMGQAGLRSRDFLESPVGVDPLRGPAGSRG
jgi:DNA-binding NtrC family response regulator